MKRVPVKPIPLALGDDGEPLADGSEDIECAICDDGECENSNAIVFCDGCNLAVHQGKKGKARMSSSYLHPNLRLDQDCYGIPYIPEGQWLCRKCTVSPDRAVTCVLCPHEGGAFKQTTQGKWAHLLCAMWIPETGVSNPVYMEPIDSIERVPKARWKLLCYICNRKTGACIQCDKQNCFQAFHVTCARRGGLLLKSQRQRITHSQEDDSDDDDSSEVLRAWCHRHVPKELRAERALLLGKDEDMFQDASSQMGSPSPPNLKKGTSQLAVVTAPGRKKSARAYKKSYRAGPSLVPAYVINRVLEHISRISIRKKPHLALQIAKFWSLKREARRGAPLLKRLHLEPWTATTGNKEQSDAERIKKLQFLLRLREDLEKVRMLAELVRKREKEKLRQVQVMRSALVDSVLFPYQDNLRAILQRVASLDRNSLLLEPVSAEQVPDYYEIVKRPMDWSTILKKINEYRYDSVIQFKEDIFLVLDNAMLYNKIDTHFHRTAARIKKVAQPVFEELDRLHQMHGSDSELQLEAEDSIVELLGEYTEEEQTPGMGECTNAVDELTTFFFVEEKSEGSVKGDQTTTPKITYQSRKAAERAARSERSRLAAQRRKELQEEQAANASMASVTEADESFQSTRSVKRQSTLKASLASLEARKKKTAEQTARKSRAMAESQAESSEEEELPSSDATNLEVEQVSSHDSFSRFNTGWVLPEGSKRKRAMQSSDSVRMLSDQLSSSLKKEPKDTSSELSEPEEVASSSHRRTRSGDANLSVKRKRSTSSAGTSETPTRRMPRTSTGQFARISNPVRPRHTYQGETKREEQSRKKREAKKKQKGKDGFSPSTLCWAKVEGHAAYPAEIFDEESDDVPDKVLEQKDRAKRGDNEEVHLVRFFGASLSFGWIPTSKLKLLLEDEELDQRMLKAPKTSKERNAVLKSYESAKEQLEA